MGIQKREFYEGAALHRLLRAGCVSSLEYTPPYFLLNNMLLLSIKYSTRTRTPWGFTFTPPEQNALAQNAAQNPLVLALVCGADGVVALPYSHFIRIASPRATALHVSCSRKHGQHYSISGPDGDLPTRIAPSDWSQILVSAKTT